MATDLLKYVGKTAAVEPTLIKVTDGVYAFAGGSICIRTMIEAPQGLVIFDTGDDAEDGAKALAAFRSVSSAPVAAIIYSHNHYAHGTAAFLAAEQTGGRTTTRRRPTAPWRAARPGVASDGCGACRPP